MAENGAARHETSFGEHMLHDGVVSVRVYANVVSALQGKLDRLLQKTAQCPVVSGAMDDAIGLIVRPRAVYDAGIRGIGLR